MPIFPVVPDNNNRNLIVKRGFKGSLLGCRSDPSNFSPLSIAGLQLWLKADVAVYSDAGSTLAVNSDPVAQWNDVSGSNHHVSQATASKRPTLLTGIKAGLPVVRFDGVDDFLISSGFTLNQPHTRLGVIINRSATAGANVMVDGITDDLGYWYWTAADTLTMHAGAAVTTTGVGTDWNVIRGVFNGVSSKLSINAGAAGTGDVGAGNAGGITLGSGGAGAAYWTDCDIGEILEYDTALSDANVANLLNYLNNRWQVY